MGIVYLFFPHLVIRSSLLWQLPNCNRSSECFIWEGSGRAIRGYSVDITVKNFHLRSLLLDYLQDLDLRRPGVWKPTERPQFEVTTEEVLKKADFRVSISLAISVLCDVSVPVSCTNSFTSWLVDGWWLLHPWLVLISGMGIIICYIFCLFWCLWYSWNSSSKHNLSGQLL